MLCVGQFGQFSSSQASLGNLTITNTHWTYQDQDIVLGKITVPPPALDISQSDSNIVLAWPAWADRVNVESAVALGGGWQPVTNTLARSPQQNVLSRPRDEAQQYLRLKLR